MAAAISEMERDDVLETNTRSARQIALQAALLGLLADNVLRNAQDGLGWSVWIAALAIASVLVLRYRGEAIRAERGAWLAVAVLCASAVAWRASEALVAGNVLGTLIALAMFSMASSGRPAVSILSARLRDVFASWFYAWRDGAFGALPLLFRDAEFGSAIQQSASARRPALRAVILTAPLFIVFTALLSRADPVFGAIFRLPDVDAEQIASHVFLVGFFAWISAGWMRGAMLPVRGRAPWNAEIPLKLGVVEITTSLGAVLGLFAVFVAIQLRWLFGGAEVVQATTGLSVAEYARRGFFELVMVAALVLPLIVGTRALVGEPATLRRHTRLSMALLVLLGAIMTSAALRMNLYVAHFGLTTDRLFALVFMMWLAVVFVALALTVLKGWDRPFPAVAMLSGFATLFAMTVANPEAIVARVNLGRSVTSQPIDYEYLSRLSGDALPQVVAALVSAPPSENACAAARRLRRRALERAGVRPSNVGTARGNEAARAISMGHVQRLCGT